MLLDDYPNMLARANAFDSKLASDALAITPQNSDYANILALSARQLFGAIEITSGWDGTTQISTDIMAFMRSKWFICDISGRLLTLNKLLWCDIVVILNLVKGLTDLREVHEHG